MGRITLSNIVEEEPEPRPDHISLSASEDSSAGNKQPEIVYFIGATCKASAWFTCSFPCSVVDINDDDSDDSIINKLSQEVAMNTMYGGGSIRTYANTSVFNSENESGLRLPGDPNVMLVQLREQSTMDSSAETISSEDDEIINHSVVSAFAPDDSPRKTKFSP